MMMTWLVVRCWITKRVALYMMGVSPLWWLATAQVVTG